MIRRATFTGLLASLLVLTACSGQDGTVDVAFMDSETNLFAGGLRLSPAAQHLRAATRSGLVALDERGEVIPALADRWNVIEDGSIFVFRLRDGTWPNGDELTADSVRVALNRAIRGLRGTSLGRDLAPVDEVRAMAGSVVEIRLASPLPDLLLLLAQPELALSHGEGETGPMQLLREDGRITLTMRPPEERGLPQQEDWRDHVRDLHLHTLAPAAAIAAFRNGEVDVVLGGRLDSLPMADTGPLSRGTVRLDPVEGLFGLQVRRARGVLNTPESREAIAMAIDRAALAERFNVGGWETSTRIVPGGLPNDPGLGGERWQGQTIEQRRQSAAARIAGWRSSAGENAAAGLTISVEIADTAGFARLFDELRTQLAGVGVTLVRVDEGDSGDLVLVDRVARYAAPRWFLNQFNCILDQGLCSEDADILVGRALDETDPVRRAVLLASAEQALADANIYIPFGSPLRWSLVRGNVDGFSENRWGFHPLPDMAVIPR